MKDCRECGQYLEAQAFNKCSGQKDGLQAYCRDCQRAKKAAWYGENRERALAYAMSYAEEHPADHALTRRRTGIKKNHLWKERLPKWANRDAILSLYEECPVGYEVDHVIPLRSNTVSGLHVETNLQYLTPEENARKRAHYVP